MFVGCVVLVDIEAQQYYTTRNMNLFNSRRFEYKLIFR